VTPAASPGIHVATVGIGDEGGTCLEGGRRDPDRAVHRVEWQDRDVLALGGSVRDVPHEVDREGVAGLRARDEDRPGLRIHEREVDHAGDMVVRPTHLAAERILGPQLEDVARSHGSFRRHAPNVHTNSDGSGR